MERWDVYNENKEKIGKTILRDRDTLGPGEYHLVVHVCVFDREGRMLIQRRTEGRAWGGYWDFSAGGSALAGEDSRTAAEREFFEELGMRIDLSKVHPTFSFHFDRGNRRGFDDFYLVNDFAHPPAFPLSEEVAQVRFATMSEVRAMIKSGAFIPYLDALIPLLFSVRGRYELRMSDREENS